MFGKALLNSVLRLDHVHKRSDCWGIWVIRQYFPLAKLSVPAASTVCLNGTPGSRTFSQQGRSGLHGSIGLWGA